MCCVTCTIRGVVIEIVVTLRYNDTQKPELRRHTPYMYSRGYFIYTFNIASFDGTVLRILIASGGQMLAAARPGWPFSHTHNRGETLKNQPAISIVPGYFCLQKLCGPRYSNDTKRPSHRTPSEPESVAVSLSVAQRMTARRERFSCRSYLYLVDAMWMVVCCRFILLLYVYTLPFLHQLSSCCCCWLRLVAAGSCCRSTTV